MFGGQAQGGLAVEVEGKGDRLVGHGLTLDLVRDGHGLGPFRLHELKPGRGGVEQVADLDAGAVRAGEAGGGYRALVAALDSDLVSVAVFRPAGDGQAGDGADRGQGLAAETQGVDAQQVDVARVVRFELGRRVPLDREGQLVRGHAVAVVGDQDAGEAAAVSLDLDPGRAGVQRILDQFLDGAGRPLDHLASGDAIDGFGRETTDGHVSRQDRG